MWFTVFRCCLQYLGVVYSIYLCIADVVHMKLGENARQLIKCAVHKLNFGSYGSGTAL